MRFAIAIQREFRDAAVWHGQEEPIAFRIGINLGEVLLGGEANVQGHSVNVAARVQALARAGGICITEAVRQAEINGSPAPAAAEPASISRDLVLPFTEASVAVLPLQNLSSDPRNGHLCDGFTGDIITNLSRFRDLLVIARHSAFLFRDRDSPSAQIATQLGVQYLMTGGMQRIGRKLRLRVQLTEADTDRVICRTASTATSASFSTSRTKSAL